MKSIKVFLWCAFLLFFSTIATVTLTSYGQSISLKEIFDAADAFDGKVVAVEGEVIGEPLKGRDGVWINIVSQGNNIGVFFKDKEELEKIKHWGSYKERGDYLSIIGIFYKHCPQHQEGDIHAQQVTVLRPGMVRRESLAPSKVTLTIIFFILCLTLVIIYLIKIYKRR